MPGKLFTNICAPPGGVDRLRRTLQRRARNHQRRQAISGAVLVALVVMSWRSEPTAHDPTERPSQTATLAVAARHPALAVLANDPLPPVALLNEDPQRVLTQVATASPTLVLYLHDTRVVP